MTHWQARLDQYFTWQVQSAETLDSLEGMIQVFEKIPNNGVETPTLANFPTPVFEKTFIKWESVCYLSQAFYV